MNYDAMAQWLAQDAIRQTANFAGSTALAMTRAQISERSISQSAFSVAGEDAPGDWGSGAIYVEGASSGLRAIQDATGRWFELATSMPAKSVGWLGAKGDGSDDTAAFLLMGSVGGSWIVPPGLVTLHAPILITAPLDLTVAPGAVIKWGAAPEAGAYNNARGILEYRAGSQGSRLDVQGWLDGNRDQLIEDFLALPWIDGSPAVSGAWAGVWVDHGALEIPMLRARNIMCGALMGIACDGLKVGRLHAENCTKLYLLQSGKVSVGFADGVDITNEADGRTIPTYQYAAEVRNLVTGTNLGTVRVKNYRPLIYAGTAGDPGERVGDPQGGLFSADHCDGVVVENVLDLDGFGGFGSNDPRVIPVAYGVMMDACRDTWVKYANVKGYFWGATISSCIASGIQAGVLDGAGNITTGESVAPAAALRVKGFGGLPSNTDLSSGYDHYTAVPNRDCYVGPLLLTGSYFGLHATAGGVALMGTMCHGNSSNGIQLWAASYPEPHLGHLPSGRLSLIGVSSRFNSGAGLACVDMSYVDIVGGDFSDNGQDVTEAAGINFWGGAPRSHISIRGAIGARDTQGWVAVDGVSFKPGTAPASGLYQVIFASGENKFPNQNVSLRNAGGPGVHITAKIKSLTLDHPAAFGAAYSIVQVSPGTVFSEEGNLTPLTGTVSVPASSNLLTGSGTEFTSELSTECVMKVAGQYRKIGAITSDTDMQLDDQSATPISGAAAEVIRCDVHGIPSQYFGIYVPESSNVTNLRWNEDMDFSGLISEMTHIGDLDAVSPGQGWLMQGPEINMTGVSSVPLFGNPVSLGAHSEQFVIEEFRFQVMSTLTGTDGTLRVALNNNDTHKDVASGLSVTQNTKSHGVVTPPLMGNSGGYGGGGINYLAYVEGGADNIPSSGSVRGDIVIRKIRCVPFRDV